MQEVWKFYRKTRYLGKIRIYEVSNLGNVKCNGEPYQCRIGTDGYYYLGAKLLHRIVAELFISNPHNYPVVDHIDGNKLNNRVDNLRWCTQKDNMNNPIWLKRNGETHKGLTPWNKGIPHTEETKQKMKDNHKGVSGMHRVYRTDGTFFMEKN